MTKNVRLENYSLQEIEDLYYYGHISEAQVLDYLDKWNNSGLHLTKAYLDGCHIRQTSL